ncbi:MAG: PH domain-containing protein [Clostridiales bacterium]|nr:PH domain-containing protein [Clostridiales bacterium]
MNILWSDKKRLLFFGLPWTFTRYTCTPEKFITESGLLSTKEEEIRLYRVMDLTLECSLMQRIFGLGTIVCDTVDKSMPKLYIQNIKNAKNVKELISDAVEEERMKKRVSSREYMAMDDEDAPEDEE